MPEGRSYAFYAIPGLLSNNFGSFLILVDYIATDIKKHRFWKRIVKGFVARMLFASVSYFITLFIIFCFEYYDPASITLDI